MARAGAQTIYACDLRPQDLPSLVELVKAEGLKTQVVPVVLDVADEAATRALCERTIQEKGRLDFYCANAGISDVKGFWETEASDFVRTVFTSLCESRTDLPLIRRSACTKSWLLEPSTLSSMALELWQLPRKRSRSQKGR